MSSTIPRVDHLRAQVAAYERYGRVDDADRVRTKLAVAVLESRIADVVSMTPAPDRDDRARLAALLDEGTEHADDP